MRGSYFISDLHLFSRRSEADLHADTIWAHAREAHTFVLGGDIFDFKWTTLGSVDDTIEAAIDWLHELVDPHPDCEFHFVLGNHDSHGGFIERLSDWSDSIDNFSWQHYYLRLEDHLFLHGDVADRKMCQRRLQTRRSRYHKKGKRPAAAHWLYDVAVDAGLHKMASSVVHRKRRVAKRILNYMEHIGHGPEAGVEHVYFGHTHTQMSAFPYGGIHFHNGGAPIKGLDFSILSTGVGPSRTGGGQ
jgi:UDP-2,3-diacylglucosamine hydrolase